MLHSCTLEFANAYQRFYTRPLERLSTMIYFHFSIRGDHAVLNSHDVSAQPIQSMLKQSLS
jgi:hypothetical protein